MLTTLISVEELASKLEQDDLVVLDCRFYLADLKKGEQAYKEGHIPGAIFVDLHTQLAGQEMQLSGRHPLPSEKEFSEQVMNWGIYQNSDIVVYDDMGGAFAARAWWMLVQQGLKVRVLEGGYPEWCRAEKPISQELPLIAKSSEPIEVSFPWFVSEEQIVSNFETDVFELVDARSNDRFNGENETMDPVAGHIPGALNRPFLDNLNDGHKFKEKSELLESFHSLLQKGKKDAAQIVNYCGSGVTACHNVLAMNHVGIEAKYVYTGSWSQWSKRMVRMLNS